MSLDQPTVQEISDGIIARLQTTLNQTIPLLPRAFLRVLSKTLAATYVLLWKYAGFIFLQVFVKTASIDETTILGVKVSPLKFWGRLIGVGDPTPAVQAQLQAEVSVITQGGTLQSGSQLIASQNGVTYVTVGPVLLNAATVNALIRAASDQGGGDGSGAIGNLSIAEQLSFANPPAAVVREVTVVNQVVVGADQEQTEVYRQRIIDRFQKRRQGGALVDYESWGEEAAGIVNVYPYSGAVAGQVDVFVEATPASSGSADGIPTLAQLQATLDLILLDDNGLASRTPGNAFPNVYPITRKGFDVRVIGLSVNNLAQVQADITSELTAYFLAREPFILGVTLPPRKDQITRSALVGLVEDIVTAANGTFINVAFFETGLSTSLVTYVLAQGEKSKLVAASYI